MTVAGLALAAALLGAEPGTLVLGPADDATVEVRDADGAVATVVITPDRAVELTLPEGQYAVVGADGAPIGEVRVDAGARRGLALAGQVVPKAVTAEADAARPRDPATEPTAPRKTTAKPRARGTGEWKRWGAPLLSALIPGLGQGINQQPGKAVAVFTGALGGALGSAALWRLRDRTEGADRDDQGASRGAEIARLAGFSGLTSALGLLYVGQILEAHATARGRKAEPKRAHTLGIEVARSSAVGQRPGEPAYALYDDFSVSLMGQVARRVTVGASDLGVKLAPNTFTLQGGVRSMYRFYDRRLRVPKTPTKIWLSVGGGFIFQGSSRSRPGGAVDDEAEVEQATERLFGAVVYGQFEARWFLLDRWAIGLAPRVSLPLTRRTYGRLKQIPRLSTTFELGAFVGVYL